MQIKNCRACGIELKHLGLTIGYGQVYSREVWICAKCGRILAEQIEEWDDEDLINLASYYPEIKEFEFYGVLNES